MLVPLGLSLCAKPALKTNVGRNRFEWCCYEVPEGFAGRRLVKAHFVRCIKPWHSSKHHTLTVQWLKLNVKVFLRNATPKVKLSSPTYYDFNLWINAYVFFLIENLNKRLPVNKVPAPSPVHSVWTLEVVKGETSARVRLSLLFCWMEFSKSDYYGNVWKIAKVLIRERWLLKWRTNSDILVFLKDTEGKESKCRS